MQEYRNELRHIEAIPYVPGSPPPSYKSHTTIERPGIHIIFPRNEEFPNSNPPTYRLRHQVERPTILNNSSLTASDCELAPNRFSMSSTAALVPSEQVNEATTPAGIINQSFCTSDCNLELSAQRLEFDYDTHAGVVRNSFEGLEADNAQTVNQSHSATISIIPESVVLNMLTNDENSSTL